MENTTKTRILEEALVMFANNGYKGTNLRDLAAQLGLSKSALYRHYDSKECIWNAIFDRMEAYYDEHFGSVDHFPEIPQSCEAFVSMTMRMVDFTIHDQNIILIRRLLLTEQFHDDRACKMATKHFFTGTKQIYTMLFKKMIAEGLLKQDDPEMMGLAFTAPITSLIHLCDREPDREAEVLREIEAFVRYFIEMHAKV